MGYTGPQLDDSEGVDVGLDGREAEEYKYLSGRCRHYKLIGETHGSAGPNHPVVSIYLVSVTWCDYELGFIQTYLFLFCLQVQKVVRELILGE